MMVLTQILSGLSLKLYSVGVFIWNQWIQEAAVEQMII